MSRSSIQLSIARQLLERYDPGEPFHLYLKRYFAVNRKHGSSDRRILRDLCYSFFRIGRLWSSLEMDERILSAYYLVHPAPAEFLGSIRPDWPVPSSLDPEDRAAAIGKKWEPKEVFPFASELSEGIDGMLFAIAHLRQPDLFIRIRPGKDKIVMGRLQQHGIPFISKGGRALAIGNATSLESRFSIDEEIVVQDLSSQRISELFACLPERKSWKIWDACAASGGKSILLHDHLSSVELTCTDLRPSILNNLSKRLGRAGVPVCHIQTDDLTRSRDRSSLGSFDLIVADVPCTGSGTWSRTPEQLRSFDPNSIEKYASRQTMILSNLIPSLNPDGFLLYLTCSAFQRENAAQVDWLRQAHALEMVAERLFKGYEEKADTMYAVLLRRLS